ncbi:hypothetical protein CMV_005306 [Castanea mollissima]|uniref:Uncharacterized protein n=1 Tax=Castanea mollissima TaxID=60419 RepID=A0A8J4W4E3_9ROSI|nr:hypothetical protein CMV_005306 [Castanea mollissima]
MSDMCPLVSGITTRDAALSVELGMQALDLAAGRATLHSLADNVQKEKEMDGSASELENAFTANRGPSCHKAFRE